jgi:hypothetical protein
VTNNVDFENDVPNIHFLNTNEELDEFFGANMDPGARRTCCRRIPISEGSSNLSQVLKFHMQM